MNLDDKHIFHPSLGQVPTAGNRFQAILKAAKRLHVIQADEAHQDAVNNRIRRKSALRAVVLK